MLLELRTRSQARIAARPPAGGAPGCRHLPADATVFLVDEDRQVRDSLVHLLELNGVCVAAFADGAAFLAAYRPSTDTCLLVDTVNPGITGLALLDALAAIADPLPVIVLTSNSDVPMAVAAMKAGATDFIELPIGGDALVASVARAFDRSRSAWAARAQHDDAARQLGALTARQHEIMALVLAGQPSKIIAADLGISQRTVENHRAAIMRKSGSKSLPALARLVMSVDDGRQRRAAG
ncbi:response regulator transcription factor [Polymorphobacter arshaanensis]|nr:response regulator [Polymorphobacter arshaanensis]